MTSQRNPEIETLTAQLLKGDRRALGKGITLVESTQEGDEKDAEQLLTGIMPNSGKSLRLGVSGSPGVGKSTFIEALGMSFIAKGKRVAVLAIDPSSPVTGGSILGDKTRMDRLAVSPDSFIRPSPSGDVSGGVARHTRESILLCEAAGYEMIIVETVGVGQSDVVVSSMVDYFILLQQPYAGDELQGIKRGILELADLICVTKADGESLLAAQRTKGDLEQALSFGYGSRDIAAKVFLVSKDNPSTIAVLANQLIAMSNDLAFKENLAARRREQTQMWFDHEVQSYVMEFLKKTRKTQFYRQSCHEAEEQSIPISSAARKFGQRLLKAP